ncbi:ethylene receptor homolog [Nannochloropsis oceanica]
MRIDGSGVSAMSTADLVIAIAYFFIPVEITMYLLRRRHMMHLHPRFWFTGALFISFILLCGLTHLFNMLNLPTNVILFTKWATAIVSVSTSLLLLHVIPEALSLPQFIKELTFENKSMKDFRGVMVAVRRDLREEAIIDNARHKLRRILPARTLIDISTDAIPPHFLHAPRDVLTLPIMGGLSMHLRRSRVNEAQVMWLHDVCLQMKQALQQAAHLRNNFQSNMQHHQPVGGLDGELCLTQLNSSSSSSSLYVTGKGRDEGLEMLGGRHVDKGSEEACRTRLYSSTTSVHKVAPTSCITSKAASSALAPSLPPSPQSAVFKAPFLATAAAAADGPVAPVCFHRNSSSSSTALPVAALGGEGTLYPHSHGQEEKQQQLQHQLDQQQERKDDRGPPFEKVDRVWEAECALARLRIKCAGILSRVLTLVDFMDIESLTPFQKKCMVLIKEAAQADLV